ncbi:MAG TPA: hypothetical protein PKC25_04125 [Candidatus Rifleibacterium sp.]|nr:hypothetical protein [Candidatus Rifleibacterium sp.]
MVAAPTVRIAGVRNSRTVGRNRFRSHGSSSDWENREIRRSELSKAPEKEARSRSSMNRWLRADANR